MNHKSYFLNLFCLDLNNTASSPRNSSSYKDFAGFGKNFYNLQIFDSDLLAPHPTGHAHTFDDPATGATATPDRTRLALGMFLPMRAGATRKSMPLDHPWKTLPLDVPGTVTISPSCKAKTCR